MIHFILDVPKEGVFFFQSNQATENVGELLDQTVSNWWRFKDKNLANLLKSLKKRFPDIQPYTTEETEVREECNRLRRAGFVPWLICIEFDRPTWTTPWLVNENGERINNDGVLMRLCDRLGNAYPPAPEGMRRWRVSLIYNNSGSYSDRDRIYMATEPRDAVQQALDYNTNYVFPKEPQEGETEQQTASRVEFGSAFHKAFFGDPEKLNWASAEDIDTREYLFFSGPELGPAKEVEDTFNGFVKMFSGNLTVGE